jgi:hypothetical protein
MKIRDVGYEAVLTRENIFTVLRILLQQYTTAVAIGANIAACTVDTRY